MSPRAALLVALCVALSGCRKPSKRHEPPADQPRHEAQAASAEPARETGKKAPKKRKKTGKKPVLKKGDKVPDEPSPKGDGDCGVVVVEGVDVPLDCVTEHRDPLGIEGVDVVARAAIDGDADMAGGLQLLEAVDHRDEGTEGPVRSQGQVGSCTAHAFASAIDHALMRRDGEPSRVSVLHLWSRYHRSQAAHADRNIGRVVASEDDMPYDPRLACMWVSSKGCKGCQIKGEHVPCKQPVDGALVAAADKKPYARVLHTTRIDGVTPLQMKKIIARGQDVWMGMKINKQAFKAPSKGDHVIGDFEPNTKAPGHSMVISGYKTQPDGTYFLLHNSWGPKWGDGGYAWVHERQLSTVQMARVVEAVRHGEPLPPGLAEPTPPSPACDGDKAPDAATQACVARCPDGGPRLAGACAGEGCERGEVEVMGRCVASAPTRKGVVKESGVSFDCHPGGCVYQIPAGKLGCAGAGCSFSCAAPAFLLEHGEAGLFCSE